MMNAIDFDAARIDELFAPYDRGDAPGFAVGIAVGGRPVYRRGFGLASVELPVVLSPGMRMRIGSVTKHFTALAILLLAEDGLLSIDDSPRRRLPELPDWAEAMTLRQLMAHTSGMRDSLDLILHAAGPGKPATGDFQRDTLARLDSVNFAPGTSWSYNNGGYVLLSEIVARVSGMPFADFLRRRIFTPVGMHDTLLRPLDTDLVSNSATLHVPAPDGGWMRGVFGAPIGGEGGIVSTVDDMLRWLAHMSAPSVGTPDSWTALRTPLTTHGYGLGLFVDRHRGLDTVHHAGAVVGGSSQMTKVLGHDLDIVMMSNGRPSLEGYRLVDAIIDCCIPGLPPLPDNVAATPVVGTFHSAATGRVVKLGEQDGVQTLTLGAFTLPAHRDGDGALSVAILPTDLRVTPSGDGDTLDVTEFGTADRLARVEPPQDVVSIAGDYRNSAAQLSAVIDASAAEMTITGPLGAMRYTLTALGPSLWEARAHDALPLVATIETDAHGLLFTTGRTIRLAFTRL